MSTYSIGYWEAYVFRGDFAGSGGLRGRIFPWSNFSRGRGDCYEEGLDFPALFKKDQKLNIYKKTFFFKQHQNLKQTEMILYMKGFAP